MTETTKLSTEVSRYTLTGAAASHAKQAGETIAEARRSLTAAAALLDIHHEGHRISQGSYEAITKADALLAQAVRALSDVTTY